MISVHPWPPSLGYWTGNKLSRLHVPHQRRRGAHLRGPAGRHLVLSGPRGRLDPRCRTSALTPVAPARLVARQNHNALAPPSSPRPASSAPRAGARITPQRRRAAAPLAAWRERGGWQQAQPRWRESLLRGPELHRHGTVPIRDSSVTVLSGDASLASGGEEPLFAARSGGGVGGSSMPR